MKIKITSLLSILTGIILFQACSTEKNTPVTRFYHNTTSHFNVYFNGEESLKNAQKKINDMPDNYTILLPIFKSEKPEAKSLVSAETERATVKAVKLIDRHSITVKPERKDPKGKLTPEERKKMEEFYNKPEYNNWVDDAYLLIGKAHYYQQDYRTAMKSLQLILNKFRKEDIRFDAMYWLARSYSALGNYGDAENYLKMMTSDTHFPEKKFRYDVDLAYADIYIKQKKYDKAIDLLNQLTEQTKKRKQRARLTYIIAQLYQLTGQNNKALEAYDAVINMNPPYEMAFSAKISMAKSYDADSGNPDKLKKTLYKMLKDDKNIDYQDQIYYALAEIDMSNKDTLSAKKNYLKSTQKSMGNMNQKALSFLSLADIYFNEPDYLNAGAYYDSTMSVLDKRHPDYEKISRKAKNLSNLVSNIRIVMQEDSLQRVAKMDSADRLIYIEQIIAKVKADEIAARNIGYQAGSDEFSPDMNSTNKGKWYFYNPQSVSIGRTEFKKMWGNRKLEDHWRRANKAIINNIPEETNETDTAGRVTDNKKVEFYLQNLPLTDSLLSISDDKIANALFQTGVIYEQKMKDFKEASLAYEELIHRYPEHNLVVEALFNLYMINYKNLNNKAVAEKYRQQILKDFPKSKYAGILSDPDYMKKLAQTKTRINKLYEECYTAYKNGNYELTVAKAEEARKVFEKNALAAKFTYFEAMAYGSKGNIGKMKKGIEDVIKNYPEDEVTPKAKKVLAVINSGKYDADYYTFTASGEYYYDIIIPNDKAKINRIKFLLSSFNVRALPEKELRIETQSFDDDKIQIIVKSMNGKAEAEKFFLKLKSENLLREFDGDYQHFIIDKSNFEKLQKLQWTDKYLQFFNEHYSL